MKGCLLVVVPLIGAAIGFWLTRSGIGVVVGLVIGGLALAKLNSL